MVAQHRPPTEHDTPDNDRRWPLDSSVLERRRAARQLDRLLDVTAYPDPDTAYPAISLREVA